MFGPSRPPKHGSKATPDPKGKKERWCVRISLNRAHARDVYKHFLTSRKKYGGRWVSFSRARIMGVGSLWWTKPTDRPPVWRASEMQRQVSVIILLGSSFVVFRFLLFDWTPSRGCPWGPIKLFLDGPLSRNEGFIDWSDCCGLRFRNVARGVKRLYWSRRWNLFDSNWWWWWITTSVLRSRDE